MPELEADGRVTIDPQELASAALRKVAAELAGLDPEAHDIVRRTLHRLAQLSTMALGAGPELMKYIRIERKAALATLANLGEEKAAKVSKAILASLGAVLTVPIDALMDRIPLSPSE